MHHLNNTVIMQTEQLGQIEAVEEEREEGLIAQMEREAAEAGLGGWFNGNPEDISESWSGSNSDASASQD